MVFCLLTQLDIIRVLEVSSTLQLSPDTAFVVYIISLFVETPTWTQLLAFFETIEWDTS